MTSHDSIYHRFFSHPKMVVDLMRTFLSPDLLAEMDLSRMDRVNVKYDATGIRREGDVVWRIPTWGGVDLYVLLLLEFQSTIEWWMSVRIGVYVGLLYQQLIAEKKLGMGDALPPVLPLVLYNGETRWNAPTHLRQLISVSDGSPLWKLQPEAGYYLLDEGSYAVEDLAQRDALSALLFRLEQCQTPEAMDPLIDDLIRWFRCHPDCAMLKPLFAELVARSISSLKRASKRASVDLQIPEDLEEVRNMLAQRVEMWKQDWIRQGFQDGRKESIQELLLRMLNWRFGSVPAWVDETMAKADLPSLEVWSRRVFEVNTLEEVFGA
ncbi:MAG: Rpn family recombination-promoting nuclease/putative transposase [Magnetococcus sp. YQC-5]